MTSCLESKRFAEYEFLTAKVFSFPNRLFTWLGFVLVSRDALGLVGSFGKEYLTDVHSMIQILLFLKAYNFFHLRRVWQLNPNTFSLIAGFVVFPNTLRAPTMTPSWRMSFFFFFFFWAGMQRPILLFPREFLQSWIDVVGKIVLFLLTLEDNC